MKTKSKIELIEPISDYHHPTNCHCFKCREKKIGRFYKARHVERKKDMIAFICADCI